MLAYATISAPGTKGSLVQRELSAKLTWVRLQEREARLAKSNPYSVEGLMHCKSKFAKQYSTTPGL